MIPLVLITSIFKRDYPSLFTHEIALGIVGATAVTGRIEGRAVWSYYGLAGQRPVAKLLAGWTGGLVCLSLVVGVLHSTCESWTRRR
jgi:hypothetical protein